MLDRTNQKPRRLSKTTEAILDQWAQGRAASLIGKSLGLNKGAIMGRIWRARRDGDPRAAARQTNEFNIERLDYDGIRQKWGAGWTYREIAEFFGCSRSSARHIVKYEVRATDREPSRQFLPMADAAFWVREARKRDISPTELKLRVLRICEGGLLDAVLDDGE